MFKNPEQDSDLIVTIHHECFLMKASFDEFEFLAKKQILASLNAVEKVRLFSAYTSFLHHLYEFYVACFMREQGSDDGFSGRAGSEKKDKLFLGETHRVFQQFCDRLKAGCGLGWENDLSYYDVEIPEDFAKKFRRIRNSTAHAITERNSDDNNLTDFYENYHKFIYELYRSARNYWGRFDVSNLDMKSIGSFSVVVKKDG
ncbi:hypothetical protein DKY63_29520 [Pseudomonas putida]|uniref:Uncharacterized protein n=1 Tax=Pseudomonas putida TaxID=303 RepID=A0A2Z4RS33_PSEPU|nr:hypothetical protein [Pseudomonas putida]AWY43829.1 hypothetical protein DKY63_29520 [Pseudomonas putida]